MVRFIAVSVLLSSLAFACIAIPQDSENEATPVPLNLLPPGRNSEDLKFFFWPFNFWNGFKPLPWIPLPGLFQRTTAAPDVDETTTTGEDPTTTDDPTTTPDVPE